MIRATTIRYSKHAHISNKAKRLFIADYSPKAQRAQAQASEYGST